MIRRVLFFMMISVSSYAQDTLAVVESKYKPNNPLVFTQGDSTFIDFVHATGRTGVYETISGWHYGKQQIAGVDFKARGKEPLFGVQKYADTIYYHGYSNKGKNATIITWRSIGFGQATIVAENEVSGNVMGGYARAGVITVVAFDRKAKKVYVCDIRRDKLVARNELAFPWDINQVEPTDVTFLSPEHYNKIQLASESFKGIYTRQYASNCLRRLLSPNGGSKGL